MKILINGCHGFIASNLYLYLKNKGHTIYAMSHQKLDPLCAEHIKTFFKNNEVDVVFHTIAKGGSRTRTSLINDCYDSLLMFENMITYSKCKLFINFGSGAEFDQRFDIIQAKEEDIFKKVPTDSYGLAKNIISRRMLGITHCKAINLRLFNCFGYNEAWYRLIRTGIISAIEHKPITIVDRMVDFFYIEDLCRVVEWCIQNFNESPKDINCVYTEKHTILDIVKKIQKIVGYENQIIFDKKMTSYTGDGHLLETLNIPLINLNQGIIETYNLINAQRKITNESK